MFTSGGKATGPGTDETTTTRPQGPQNGRDKPQRRGAMQNRRDFLTRTGLVTAAGAATLAAPHVVRAQSPIKWRLQTYAGPALGEHVVKPAIDAFNKAANGEMEIELYYSDQ